jgi:4-amino-4-deoxy-L-arabinose transferase-like glycosyltransferase
MSTDTGRLPRAVRFGWLPWILLAAAWFATMPWRALLDPDEGRYAEIPREMLASGDWITPRFDDLKYFEKPPLQYWGTAAAYAVAGVRPWSSRLWAVGLAFACLPLVFAWSRRLYGDVSARAAVTALAVSPFFVVVGHLNLLDQAFTFWLAAAVLAFTYAQTLEPRSRTERRWMLAAWACAALAVLSKGIVVGVLAGAALIVYTLIERDALTWRRLHVRLGLPLFLIITAPWFVLVSARNPSFPGFFFVHEHFARFLTTVHQRIEPWWYFLPLLLLAVLPWIASALRAVGGSSRRDAARGAPATAPARFKPLKFLGVFSAVTLVFFSASGSKLAPYILPMLPLLALLAGAQVDDLGAFARRAAKIGAALVVVVGAGLLIYSARRNGFVPQPALTWGAAAIAAALAAVPMSFFGRRVSDATGALVTAIAAILAWQFLLCAYTVTPPERSARDLVSAVRPLISAHTPLYSVGQYRETISPYLGRTLQLAGYEGELEFGLSEEPQKRMSVEEFAARWSAGGEAVAFFEPDVWDTWRRRGLPGRVIAADYHTVAVSRL